jgi:cytochrome c biogenesis protein CcmG/thiol:disulfide interchange protein DsbE
MMIKSTTNTDGALEQDLQAQAKEFRKRARRRNTIFLIVVNVFILAMIALLVSQLLTPKTGPTHSPDDTSITAGDVSSPLVGKAAPAFTLPLLNDSARKVSLSDFKGHPVIVNFWASWCDPCNQETPLLEHNWPTLKANGVILLGVDGGETSSAGIKFVQKYGVTYTNVMDTLDSATLLNYGATAKPETFFIDKNGKLVARWIGALSQDGLQQELAKIQVN